MAKASSNENTTQSVSAIDKALAAANERKAMKANNGEPKAAKPAKEAAAPKEPKKPRQTDEEKAAKLALRDTERAAKKATRDEARATKLAERNANKSPAHMKKVEKAAEKLGALGQAATLLFNEATTNLSATELATLALRIQHFNRVKATERALTQKITVGQSVEIVGGDPRFIGKTGTIAKAQRIRCYVTVEGLNKPIYLFTSDVAVTTTEALSATA